MNLKKQKMNCIATLFVVSICLAATTLFSGCEKVEDNGLTHEINELISPEILAEIESMGMPIYRGGKPPKDITGTYIVAPDICVATNRPNDEYGPGHQFADFFLTFSEQNNKKLTIKAASAQASHSGEGEGAYLVGTDDKFTVFCPMDMKTGGGHEYKTVSIFSGIITDAGIKDCYHSIFMIEGGGAVWFLIEDGQGRVVYDQDGMSERTAISKSQSTSNENSAASVMINRF
jgi:hypothetical protein